MKKLGTANSHLVEVSDETLVLGALLADFDAFDELIRRYRRALIATALSVVGCRASAEEVAQDVFLIAFQTLPSLEEPARFGAWVRAICRFRALRVRQREARTQPTTTDQLERLIDDNATNEAEASDPAWQTLRCAERQAVREALSGLSDDHHEALYLHYVEEWSLEKIAAFLTVPESTVKGRLFRARTALRRRLICEPLFENLTTKMEKKT